jgi:hypothetical protein
MAGKPKPPIKHSTDSWTAAETYINVADPIAELSGTISWWAMTQVAEECSSDWSLETPTVGP